MWNLKGESKTKKWRQTELNSWNQSDATWEHLQYILSEKWKRGKKQEISDSEEKKWKWKLKTGNKQI